MMLRFTNLLIIAVVGLALLGIVVLATILDPRSPIPSTPDRPIAETPAAPSAVEQAVQPPPTPVDLCPGIEWPGTQTAQDMVEAGLVFVNGVCEKPTVNAPRGFLAWLTSLTLPEEGWLQDLAKKVGIPALPLAILLSAAVVVTVLLGQSIIRTVLSRAPAPAGAAAASMSIKGIVLAMAAVFIMLLAISPEFRSTVGTWVNEGPFQTRYVNSVCTGVPQGTVISTTGNVVNPTEQCVVLDDFPLGSIEYLDRAGWYNPEEAANRGRNTIAIRSTLGNEIHGRISLCTLTDRPLLMDCTPR